jgi:hypothetical protein
VASGCLSALRALAWSRAACFFFRSHQPGGECLLVCVEGGELAECGLLCFFRGGQPGGQRLFICIQRGEAGAEPFIFRFDALKLRR